MDGMEQKEGNMREETIEVERHVRAKGEKGTIRLRRKENI